MQTDRGVAPKLNVRLDQADLEAGAPGGDSVARPGARRLVRAGPDRDPGGLWRPRCDAPPPDHRALVQQYFTGNGVLTWLLSPINLCADLLSRRGPAVYRLADLPVAHQQEIEACTRALTENAAQVKAHVARSLADNRRGMFSFRWYDVPQSPSLAIPAFEGDFRCIKTIALSVFNTRERTSWHFGPLRLTLRVLINLDPADAREACIQVNDCTHHWIDNPLFIFDDTFMHQSVNDVEQVRHCLFMDIVRPTRLPALFDAAVHVVSIFSGSFQRMFYKNWSFLR